MFKNIIVCVVLLSLAGCAGESDPTRELHQIFEDGWEFRLQEDPLFASYELHLPSLNFTSDKR